MQALRHFLLALQFFTRIPVTGAVARWVGFSPDMQRASMGHFPGVGLLVGSAAAGVFTLSANLLGSGTTSLLVAAVLCTGATAWLTGALHEDGLADSADGIGGGKDKENALAIMKDSRAGSYGVVALVLSFGIRSTAIAAIAPYLTPAGLAMALLAVAAASRTAMVWHWSLLPPARQGGVAASVGEPDRTATVIALTSGILIAALLLLPNASVLSLVLPLVAAIAAVLVFNRIALRKIGGHTGDTIGATQQLTEMSVLSALALAL